MNTVVPTPAPRKHKKVSDPPTGQEQSDLRKDENEIAETSTANQQQAPSKDKPTIPPRSAQPDSKMLNKAPASMKPGASPHLQSRNTEDDQGATASQLTQGEDIPEELRQYIHPAWDKLICQVKCRKQDTVKFDATEFIDPPSKLQFALDSEEMTKESAEILDAKGIVYMGDEGELSFFYKDIGFSWEKKEVKKHLVKILNNNILNGIDYLTIRRTTTAGRDLMEKLKKKIPVSLENGKVVIYSLDEVLYLVGTGIMLKNFCDLIGWEKSCEDKTKKVEDLDTEIVLDNLKKEEVGFIVGFGFHIKVEGKVQGIKFHIKDELRITGLKAKIEEALKLLDEMLKSVFPRTVQFCHPLVGKAFVDDKGEVNDTLCKWIETEVYKNGQPRVKKCLIQVKKDNEPVVTVACCSDKEAASAAKTISNCFHFHTISKSHFECFIPLVKELKAQGKLFVLSKEESVIKFTSTFDVQFHRLFSLETDYMKSNNLITSLLKDHGKHTLEEISEKHYVEIELLDERVKVTGLKTQIETAKKELKKIIVKKSIPVIGSEEIIQGADLELGKIGEQHRCICKLKEKKNLNQQMTKIKNGQVHTTWLNPVSSTKLTVIEGVATEMDFDVLLLPVTDSIYPVCLPTHLTDEVKESLAAFMAKMAPGPYKARRGEIEFFDQATCKHFEAQTVMYVVVTETNSAEVRPLDFLKEVSYTKFITNSTGRSNKTVGIPVDIMTEVQMLGTKEFVLRLAGLWKDSWSNKKDFPELFLCVTSKSTENVVQLLDSIFSESRGFAKQCDVASTGSGVKKEAPVKLKVMKGGLHKTKADVIVNSTGADLDFTQGQISKLIAEHAGGSMEKECKDKYPDGLKKDQVAVTGSGNLEKAYGVKKILHIALSRERSGNNAQSVKEIVKKCLYATEMLPEDCRSIAFPALGTGNLGYARRDVAAAMFEAAIEFMEQALHPRLEQIYFVLYEKDKEVCQVFFNEEWRREKKTEAKFLRKHSPQTGEDCLRTTVCHGKNQIEVVVGMDSLVLPSSFVEIKLSVRLSDAARQVVLKLKEKSAKEDEKWNDVAYMEVAIYCIDEEILQTIFEQVILLYSEKQRITGLVFFPLYMAGFSCPVGRQVQIMLSALQKVISSTKYVKDVCYKVDEASFTNVESHVLTAAAEKSMLRSIGSLFGIGDKPYWQKMPFKYVKQPSMSVEIVGISEESVQEAENRVTDLIQDILVKEQKKKDEKLMESTKDGTDQNKIPLGSATGFSKSMVTRGKALDSELDLSQRKRYQQQGAIPKFTGTSGKAEPSDISETFQAKDKVGGATSFLDTSFFEVTAKINQGIVDFLARVGHLDEWMKQNPEKFNVKVHQAKHTFFVTGSFLAIKDFNDHLEKLFPSGSTGKDEVKIGKAEPRDAEIRAKKIKDAQRGDEAKPDEIPHALNKNDTAVEKDAVSVKDDDIKSDGEKTVVYEYIIGNVQTKVYKGDITNLAVDCVVSSTSPKLEGNLGIAMAIEKAAGKKFKEECRNNVAKNGELREGEIRVTGAGDMHIDSVFHVYLPNKEEKILLTHLQATFIHSLKEAEFRKFSSVAFPLLATGNSGLAISKFANCFDDAVKHLNTNEKLSHVKEVHLVDRGTRRVSNLTSCLHQYFHCLRLKKTRIMAAVGDVVATRCDACVVIEGRNFAGSGRMSQHVAKLSGDNYIKEMRQLRDRSAKVGDVFETRASGEMTTICKYILHAVSPQRNHEYCKSTNQFSDDIHRTTMNVLKICEELKAISVALPMFGKSVDEKKIPTPLETCCVSMVRAIQEYLATQKDTCITEIQLLSLDNSVVYQFVDCIHKTIW